MMTADELAAERSRLETEAKTAKLTDKALQAALAMMVADLPLCGKSPKLRHASAEKQIALLDAALASVEPVEPETSAPPTIWSHGEGTYSIDGHNPLCVTGEEDLILTAFLEKGTAMQERELEEKSGATNVPRVIATLAKRYDAQLAPAIRTPDGKKCNGGYYIRVFPVKK